ncbi:MAG TPA: GNAT family N-acetyltransferase [Vicinamibacterales bacterium]|nr:GNAT family N-acetyltransferase [Vicinamibacterales bacterium]
MSEPESSVALAAMLPDLPQWVETRGMLLSGRAQILGFESREAFVARVLHGALSVVSVVGTPRADAIQEAVAGCTPMTPVIAQAGNAPHVGAALPQWSGERAIVHALPPHAVMPPGPADTVIRILSHREIGRLAHVPPGLRHELTHALDLTPVAAVFVEDTPVSFCYPCWRTETLWDVSVDTLEEYRGRRLAAAAFDFMYREMQATGRQPVWGAMESNTASLRLAARIGFVAVTEIVVFSKGHWAFLSAGFQGESPDVPKG